MRRLKLSAVVGTIVGLVASMVMSAPGAAAASSQFTDVPPSQLFYGDITWLASHDITTGNGDGTFGPAQSVTREQMAAFLYRFANSGQTAPACTSKPFPDVQVTSPFCGDIAWLKANGITAGNPDGTYGPLTPVGRQEMAAFMYRTVNDGRTAPECLTTRPFPDVPTTNPFCGAITWLAGQGVTGGFADGKYHPTAAVERQAMAAFLHRLSAPAPATAAAHYVRTTDVNALRAAGVADATADLNASGSHLHLLDIGAQLNDGTGVQLSTTSTNVSYAQLVTLLQAYLTGYGSVPGATIAIGTNNDAKDWTAYPAAERGADWADKVVDQLTPGNGVAVVGANDIEPNFGTEKVSDALGWEQAYLGAAKTSTLIFNGSADGCPYGYGQTGGICNHGWTEAQLAALAGGPHIQALPQIYNAYQAIQWANIASTAKAMGSTFTFLGSLSEDGVNAQTSQLPSRSWISLWNALTAAAIPPTLPYSADLDVIS